MNDPKKNSLTSLPPFGKPSLIFQEEAASETEFPQSDLLNVNKQSSKTSSTSERVKRLLECLEGYDSLYLCPIDKPFPDAVARRIHRRCVHKYEIKDYYGVTHFYAAELTSCCLYFCCSSARKFEIYMYDLAGKLVFESVRTCTAGLCITGTDCCFVGGAQTTANFRHSENYIGSVTPQANCSMPVFQVQNEFSDEDFIIQGPKLGFIFPCRLCKISEFIIYLPSTNAPVGKIIYGYDGLQEDRIPNPKTVGVIFPPRCSPETKACLLSAGFMIVSCSECKI